MGSWLKCAYMVLREPSPHKHPSGASEAGSVVESASRSMAMEMSVGSLAAGFARGGIAGAADEPDGARGDVLHLLLALARPAGQA